MNKTLEDIKSEVHLMLQDLTHNELKDYFSSLIYGYDKLQQRIDKAYQILDDIDEYMIPEQWLKLDKAKKILKGDSNE